MRMKMGNKRMGQKSLTIFYIHTAPHHTLNNNNGKKQQKYIIYVSITYINIQIHTQTAMYMFMYPIFTEYVKQRIFR